MNYKAESGLRLKSARMTKGMKLQGLADLTTNLSKSRISNYEQGLRLMDPDAAHQLAKVLGISAAWLLCVDDEPGLSPDELALLNKYRQTDERGKKNIQSIADTQPEVNGAKQDKLQASR